VVFKVGTEEFAVDIMLTREVVLMREITPVPETEAYVEGVMNLRGSLVPVLDFRKRLRAFRTTAHSDHRIIIASLDGRTAGLIVDGASEVIRVSDDKIEAVPHLISEMARLHRKGGEHQR
jgi:purine-binding chemotaxis protein CheW